MILYRKKFAKMDPKDVEYCGNHVFLSINNDDRPEEGRVMVLRKYNKRHNTMPVVLNLVGRIKCSLDYLYIEVAKETLYNISVAMSE